MAAQTHESLMRQKARVKWIKEGDCNSRYFYLLMNSKRRNNDIKGVYIGGSWVDDPIRVKKEVCRFFAHRFKEVDQCRPDLRGVLFGSIGLHQNDMLVGQFLEEEIRTAVWDSAMNLLMSGLMSSQKCLINLKFSPSGPGHLSLPQSHTAVLISSSRNWPTNLQQ